MWCFNYKDEWSGGGGGRVGRVMVLFSWARHCFYTALTGELFRFPDNMQVRGGGGGGGVITSDGTASHPR